MKSSFGMSDISICEIIDLCPAVILYTAMPNNYKFQNNYIIWSLIAIKKSYFVTFFEYLPDYI